MNALKILILLSLFLLLTNSGCNLERRSGTQTRSQEIERDMALIGDSIVSRADSVGDVFFFIENSGSMMGYVAHGGNYSSAIISLGYHPIFDNSTIYFNLINGTDIPRRGTGVKITPLGNDPAVLRATLTRNGFNTGDIHNSDLTRFFELAMEKAYGNNISILISDFLFDVGTDANPLISLQNEGERTKSIFRRRIAEKNLQTIIVKATSHFNGRYSFSSRTGSVNLNHDRPFYIAIFGDSYLLNAFMPDSYLEQLAGFNYSARFFLSDEITVNYRATAYNKRGEFRFDRDNPNKLIDAQPRNNIFQFSLAVDFSKLPFSSTFFLDKSNYALSNPNFNIVSISDTVPDLVGLPAEFNPTHLITINTTGRPVGELNISLLSRFPEWITNSTLVNENDIIGNQTQTYALEYLIRSISEAYQYMNNRQSIVSLKVELTQ